MSQFLLPESNGSLSLSVPKTDRKSFIDHFSSEYRSGQDVTFLGPTQRGKTTLALQLLKSVASPKRKAVILAGKPPGRDPVMTKDTAKRLRLRPVEEWPPIPSPFDRNRNGFLLQPHHTMTDPAHDDAHLKLQFHKALVDNYKSKKDVITVVDEGHHVSKDLGLQRDIDSILMRGAPVSAAWVLVQRGRFMSYQIYDAPEWLFMAYDPDRSNQMRYAEIGGVDPKQLQLILSTLKTHRTKKGGTISEFLAIRRSGPEMVIVDVA